METLIQDVRYALRVFRGNPVLVMVAVVSLAIGIGPNSVLFSLIDALGFRPLPITDPAHLVSIQSSTGKRQRDTLSYPEYVDIRQASHLFADVCASSSVAFGISGDGRPPEVAFAALVSSSYFTALGVRPIQGRTFLPEENERPGSHPVAVISERLWARRYDKDPGVLGKTVQLNARAYTVVGVLPAEFGGTQPILAPDLWVPMMMWPAIGGGGSAATLEARGNRPLSVYARLKPGVSLAQAQAEMRVLGASMAEAYPATNRDRSLTADYEQDARREKLRVAGVLSIAVVGMILLLACANVAGLMIGRAEARRAEIAVRLALGASRSRLVRQLLTESVLLSLAGAAGGLLLAFWLLRLIPSLVPEMPFTFNFDFRVDMRVLAATLAASVFAAPLFGLMPALAASRPDVVPLLKGPGGERPKRRLGRFTPRNVLVVGQIAVSLALLVSSGLLVRNFLKMQEIDPGFVARPMVFSTMSPGAAGYTGARAREFYRSLLERLSATPRVERVTMAAHLPLNRLFGGGARQNVVIPGYQLPAGETSLQVSYNTVEPAYFDTMGVRIMQGRPFADSDRAGTSPVVLINQTMARKFWPDRDPIGNYISVSPTTDSAPGQSCEIVGVVQDGKYLSLDEAPQPYLYLPFAQQPRGEMTVIARVRGDASSMVTEFKRQIWLIDPAMPIMQVTTMDQHMQAALLVERALAALVGALGGMGLLLSIVGLYGVISFVVSRRTREIGIRMALGASPVEVVRRILMDGGRLALTGIGIGLGIAAVAMGLFGRQFYGISPWDPPTYLGMAALVLLVALGGCYIPARRAARVDPISALRNE